jgi:hypothetical protein
MSLNTSKRQRDDSRAESRFLLPRRRKLRLEPPAGDRKICKDLSEWQGRSVVARKFLGILEECLFRVSEDVSSMISLARCSP